MGKIAFIDTCFTGSTLPLIRRLIEKGYQVDLYELTGSHINKLEALTFEKTPCSKGIGDVPLRYYDHIKGYMDLKLFRFRYISVLRPFASVPILRNIIHQYRMWCLRQVAKEINDEKYDIVNFISQYWDTDYIPLLERINCPKLLSLHEVCNHSNPNFDKAPALLRIAFQRKLPIIVFSEKSYSDILQYKMAHPSLVNTIHFGCFETYRYMLRPVQIVKDQDYFLFFGHLKPYKGVDIFAEAIKEITSLRQDIKFVIAGKGQSEAVEKIKDYPNVTFLNRFIDNDDLSYLLQNSYAVVCPYKTASQSGIPQTCFVFNKPIIASAIGSFKEIIGNDTFGILTEPNSPTALADAIIRLWDDKQLYQKLTNNIVKFPDIKQEYNWNDITEEYINIFNRCQH